MRLFLRPDKADAVYAFLPSGLKKLIHDGLDIWQPIPGVTVNSWGIKRIIEARRFWINLELANSCVDCLE